MPELPPPPVPTQLIVFADDWGRHPSSSQHLIRALLPQYPTLWVNTVGTRRPKLTWADLLLGAKTMGTWFLPDREDDCRDWPDGLRVIAPKMYPGFRTETQRRFNSKQIVKAVNGARLAGHRTVVVSTLPITADLVGQLGAHRWIYNCVDDYSQWPGTDHKVMDAMERQLVGAVDACAVASEQLSTRLQTMGADPILIDHGVAIEHWRTPSPDAELSRTWPSDDRPIATFWGLLDDRLDIQWVWQLANTSRCSTVLAGPRASGFAGGIAEARCVWPGMISFRDLPAHAAASSVLIMPYIDAPVTRAMQPLKLKEYLATMKPVVVRDLPSTRAWADCCDLASTAQDFVRLVNERITTGTPANHLEARRSRLPSESWATKAAQLAELINTA